MNTTNQVSTSEAIDEFRTRVFWRWNAYQEALKAGEPFDKSGDPVTVNAGVIAHGLDSIDLFLRGYVTGEYKSLYHTNTQLQHHVTLFKKLGKSDQTAYEEVFWLVIDAWKDLIELELYELVPVLKTALGKITTRFFSQASPLNFPVDPGLEDEAQVMFVYGWEISSQEIAEPESPLDYVIKRYDPHAYVNTGKERNLPSEGLRLCYYLDDISLAFRRYLMNKRATLRHFNDLVVETNKQFPSVSTEYLVTAIVNEDIRKYLAKYEVWELMPRLDEVWNKIKKRFGINQ
ncbi:hypothetical protein [Larkinella sp.]|uniref:hypothetical protein n=1 Tax=Larkinella sp. TaxID=2034517 RepID=UPI003BA878E6